MEGLQVIKIEYNGTLRRFTYPEKERISFSSLESKIRELFKFSSESSFSLSYSDSDNDIVVMSQDEELKDAIFNQKLNPLRIKVATSATNDDSTPKNNSFEKNTSTDFNTSESQNGQVREVNIDHILRTVQEAVSKSLKAADISLVEASIAMEPVVREGSKIISQTLDAFGKNQVNRMFEKSAQGTNQSSSSASDKNNATNSGPSVGVAQVVDNAIHQGVECDVCGANPIIGPRYKSENKHNYDLCDKCYLKDNAKSEYTKIEHPIFRRGGCPRYQGQHGYGFRPPFSPFFGGRAFFTGRGSHCPRFGMQQSEGKYDARFVKDITIFDGTEISPGTSFTKIWRIRNSGTVTWPTLLQVVHVGGDNLGSSEVVTIQLPEDGVVPDSEVEVSLDLTAPSLPGRYASHWRLCLPDGPKFGHRFWALIQVVLPNEQSPQVSESIVDAADAENSKVKNETDQKEFEKSEKESKDAEGLNKEDKSKVSPLQDVVNNVSLSIPIQESNSDKALKLNTLQEKPIIETKAFPTIPPSIATLPSTIPSAPAIAANSPKKSDLGEFELLELGEQDMVNDLVNMGFKDEVINLEILKNNNFNMQETIDDLVKIDEWAPAFAELKEMGFVEEKRIRELMFKNKGVIKFVVKDLIENSLNA